MLIRVTQDQDRRQALFFGLLLFPLFILIFAAGVVAGRSHDNVFPVVVTVAIMVTMSLILALGLNWRLGLYAIMYFVLWDRLLSVGDGTITATKVSIGITMVYLVTAICNNQMPRWWERLNSALAVTAILYGLVSFSSMPFMFQNELATSYVFRRISISILLLLILVAVDDREIFHRSILWLVIGGVMVAMATTSEVFTGEPLLALAGKTPNPEGKLNTIPTFGQQVRFIGPSGDPNFYALAQSAPGVIVFALLFYYKKFWPRTLLALALAIIFFNILGTGSRGGVLSFIGGAAVVLLLCPIRHRLATITIASSLLIGGAIFLVLAQVGVAANRILEPTQASEAIDYRIAYWHMCWNMFADHPFTGMGVRSWFTEFMWYRLPGSAASPQLPHNSFMHILEETGLQGVIIYVLLYFFAAFSAGCAALGTHDRRHKFESTALFGLLFGFFLFAGTSNVLENELYFIIFGLCGAAYNVYLKESRAAAVLGDDLMHPPYRHRLSEALAARQAARYPRGT